MPTRFVFSDGSTCHEREIVRAIANSNFMRDVLLHIAAIATIVNDRMTTMPTRSIGKAKLKTDATTGKTKLEPSRSYDASKRRKIAKGKTKRVVSRKKAGAAR